jgi:hypothetical protein
VKSVSSLAADRVDSSLFTTNPSPNNAIVRERGILGRGDSRSRFIIGIESLTLQTLFLASRTILQFPAPHGPFRSLLHRLPENGSIFRTT